MRLKADDQLKSQYRAMKIAGKRVDEHRYIAATILGRPLTRDEVVHHKDGNKLNNSPDNLEILSRAEHSRLHGLGRKASDKTKERLHNIRFQGMKENKPGFLHKAICSYNRKTGELVKTYISEHEAKRDGFNIWCISLCLKGKRKTHKGLGWRLA